MFHKKGNELVIIDAGAANFYNKEYKFEYIDCLFKSCTLNGVVITHLHKDHYNVIGEILTIYRKYHSNIVNIVVGSNIENSRLNHVLSLINTSNVNICIYDCIKGKTYNQFKQEIIIDLDKFISLCGKYASFYQPIAARDIIPTDTNAYSLIFALDGILYTGDANQTTIGNDIANPSIRYAISENLRPFVKKIKSKKVTVMAPHHGSKTSKSLRNALRNELKRRHKFKGFLVPNKIDDRITNFYESTLLDVSNIEFTREDNLDVNTYQILDNTDISDISSILAQ